MQGTCCLCGANTLRRSDVYCDDCKPIYRVDTQAERAFTFVSGWEHLMKRPATPTERAALICFAEAAESPPALPN